MGLTAEDAEGAGDAEIWEYWLRLLAIYSVVSAFSVAAIRLPMESFPRKAVFVLFQLFVMAPSVLFIQFLS